MSTHFIPNFVIHFCTAPAPQFLETLNRPFNRLITIFIRYFKHHEKFKSFSRHFACFSPYCRGVEMKTLLFQIPGPCSGSRFSCELLWFVLFGWTFIKHTLFGKFEVKRLPHAAYSFFGKKWNGLVLFFGQFSAFCSRRSTVTI